MVRISREIINECLLERDWAALLELFDENPAKVRRFIMRHTNYPGDEFHLNAIDAFELLCAKRSNDMPDFFLEIARRSIWEMNEEGGNVAWMAPEIIGAVIAGNPFRYGHFFSYSFHMAADELTFQPSLVRSYDRLKEKAPYLVEAFADRIEEIRQECLADGRL